MKNKNIRRSLIWSFFSWLVSLRHIFTSPSLLKDNFKDRPCESQGLTRVHALDFYLSCKGWLGSTPCFYIYRARVDSSPRLVFLSCKGWLGSTPRISILTGNRTPDPLECRRHRVNHRSLYIDNGTVRCTQTRTHTYTHKNYTPAYYYTVQYISIVLRVHIYYRDMISIFLLW